MSNTYKTTSMFNEIKIETLEKSLEVKNKQYISYFNQFENELDDGRKVLIKNKIDELENEIKIVENLLGNLTPSRKKTTNQNWESNLHKIDFKEISLTVSNVLSIIEKGGAALFLLQEYNRMGGKWCSTLIRNLLGSTIVNVRPYHIEFLPHQILDEAALLVRLRDYLNIDSVITDRQTLIDLIIDKLCDLLQIGTAIFVELRFTDNLIGRDNFLFWFISEFWQPLVKRINSLIEERPNVKFIFLISPNATLSPLQLGYSLMCNQDEFNFEKILRLRLNKWSEEEIKDWLYSFSNLGLTRSDYNRMAQSIFQTSNYGLPNEVYSLLLEYF